MQVEFKSDQPVTDAACKKATAKTLKQWFAELDKRDSAKRRESVNWLYNDQGVDVWWATTIFVEYERSNGIVNKKDGRIEGYNICVTKTVAAPVKDAYRAWVDAKVLSTWYAKGVSAKVANNGEFKDKGGNSGTFLRVRENKDLRFTWQHAKSEGPTQVDVTFADKGKGKTLITLMHNRIQNRPEADGLRAAWGAAFDRLKQTLER